MVATVVHEKSHLMIGDVSAGQETVLSKEKADAITQPPLPPDETTWTLGARRGEIYGRATPFLRHPGGGAFSS